MATPNSRSTLVDFCLRRLGYPVLNINVDTTQTDDCVDDAIQFFQEYHQDATRRTFFKHVITSTDVTNEWIPVDSTIHFVKSLLPVGASSIGGSGSHPFNSLQYQIAISDLWNSGSTFFGDMQYYAQLGQYLSTLDMMLTGQTITEYQRHGDRMYIFGEWWNSQLKVGDTVVIEAYVTIDPDTYTSIYNDMFIKNYTTALIKQRWGQNMSKFEGMQLPGGVTLSGERILAEASAEIERLEDKMRAEYEPGPDFFVG